MALEWKKPTHQPRKADIVAAELRSNPREWARIATRQPAFQFLPWWGPIWNDKNYETKIVPCDPDLPLGERDIYARYVG